MAMWTAQRGPVPASQAQTLPGSQNWLDLDMVSSYNIHNELGQQAQTTIYN